MFIVFICFFYLHTTKIPKIPKPTHHHGHFPLNHPVNPRCILIKLSNISRNDPRHNKRITYIYRISYRILKTQYCPRPTKTNNNNNTMKISCVRPHTHTHTFTMLGNRYQSNNRTINQSIMQFVMFHLRFLLLFCVY